MVLAGPGSGKTTVITHRIRRLIGAGGVDPASILVITFTKAAALQMQERFFRLMEGQCPPVVFGTFHAVFFKILKYAYNYKGNQVLPPERRMALLREIFAQCRTELEVEDENEFLMEIGNEISAVKGEGIEIGNYHSKSCPSDVFERIFRGYNEGLRRAGLLDFDDMVGMCYELFLARKDILLAWQKKYRYILIDEFQDINLLQYQVVRMLAAPENNLFIVGDDDQSIYRFRGARPEIMLHFPEDYPDCRKILLNVNYRSVKPVVDHAGLLIGQNEIRYRKALTSARGEGPEPVFAQVKNLQEENDRVMRELQQYHRNGIPWEQMALLYRTNQNPRAMVEQLMRMNLPFRMKDVVPSLYDHWIAGDMITYMLVAAGSRKRADIIRIINRPKRYIARAAFMEETVNLEKLKEYYKDKEYIVERLDRFEYDLRMLRKMAPYAAINYIRHGMGYDDFLKEYAEFRRMKPDELYEIADELQERAAGFRTLSEWLADIAEYNRKMKEQKEEAKQNAGTGINVATMHGSKGLEYEVVYILDANEGITPHKRSVLPEEIEEERRLFYVAMTRAKTHLHIYWTEEHYNKKLPVSRFVKEAGGLSTQASETRRNDERIAGVKRATAGTARKTE